MKETVTTHDGKSWVTYQVSVKRRSVIEIWNDAFGLRYSSAFYVEMIETAAGAVFFRPRGVLENFRKQVRVGNVSIGIISTSVETERVTDGEIG
jgi:hypothetical protein